MQDPARTRGVMRHPQSDADNQFLAGLYLTVGKFVQALDPFNGETIEFPGDIPKGVAGLDGIGFPSL